MKEHVEGISRKIVPCPGGGHENEENEATRTDRYELYVIRFQQARGLERRATTDPTCCPRYPPGTTLLECRFEGDEPVAHVVQVASNGKPSNQKMCLLVETRQSSSGPYSRYKTKN